MSTASVPNSRRSGPVPAALAMGRAFALTCPLITKADGGKFGKTESGNVWLDPLMTTPYKFYQFWLNVSDADAGKYIKIFTLLSKDEVAALTEEQEAAPHLRPLQKRLAEEVTCMVHGKEEYDKAVEASQILFGKATAESLTKLDKETFLAVFEGVPTFEISRAKLDGGVPVVELLAVETEAFEHFAEAHPNNVILLIDTYDTEEGAKKVVELAPRLKRKGITVKGVRLDSGDLANHAFKVRRILDEGGLPDAKITASGNLDEYAIQAMVAANAPIDLLAVGTKMTASADVPYLDCAYKLQEYAGRACRKKSEGKATWPGRKQVYRQYNQEGRIDFDILTTADDPQEGEPLIHPVMESGKRIGSPVTLTQSREHARVQLTPLPEPLRQLREGSTIEVKVSPALHDLAATVDARGQQ